MISTSTCLLLPGLFISPSTQHLSWLPPPPLPPHISRHQYPIIRRYNHRFEDVIPIRSHLQKQLLLRHPQFNCPLWYPSTTRFPTQQQSFAPSSTSITPITSSTTSTATPLEPTLPPKHLSTPKIPNILQQVQHPQHSSTSIASNTAKHPSTPRPQNTLPPYYVSTSYPVQPLYISINSFEFLSSSTSHRDSSDNIVKSSGYL